MGKLKHCKWSCYCNTSHASSLKEFDFVFQYETHKFSTGRGGSKTFYPLVFNDIMGLEDGTDSGVHPEDIYLALKGHIMEGHKVHVSTGPVRLMT